MVRWWVFLEKIVNFFHKCKFFPIHILWIFTLNYGFLIDKSCSYVLIFMILVNCMDKNSNFIQKIPIFHKALKICCREMEYILRNCRELKFFWNFVVNAWIFVKNFRKKFTKKGVVPGGGYQNFYFVNFFWGGGRGGWCKNGFV